MSSLDVTLYTDPTCPWAYSELPAFRVLEWRYGDQLDWRLVMVGLSEEVNPSGMTPAERSQSWARFRRRYGMPFTAAPKERRTFSGRACRLIVAARLLAPGSEWRVLRALQLAYFTTPLLPDDDAQLADALRDVPGVDADALVAAIADPAVEEAYQADKLETRAAEGSAAELQGKTRITDGPVRFTAPSLSFARNGLTLVAGGFQPVEAYDVLVVNLDPTLERRRAARHAGAAARALPRRPDHAGGGGPDDGGQRRARPGRRRGGAPRAGRRRGGDADAPGRRRALARGLS